MQIYLPYKVSVGHSSDLFMFLDISIFVSSGDTLIHLYLTTFKQTVTQ